MTFSFLISKYRNQLMGLAMVVVMLYHQSWLNVGPFFTWMHMLGYLGVEVFLLLSGFGIAVSLQKHSLSEFYSNRIYRLLPACLVYGILKISVGYLLDMNVPQYFLLDLFSLSHWYIYAIVVYYALSPVFKLFIEKYGWRFLVVISLLTYLILIFWQFDSSSCYLLKYGRWVLKRLPVFVLGMTLFMRPVNLKAKAYISLGTLFMLLNVVMLHYIILCNANPDSQNPLLRMFSYLPNRADVPDNGRYLLDMLSVFFICPVFVLITYIFNKMKLMGILSWMGRYSLELYLCHQLIFSMISDLTIKNSYLAFFIGCSASVAIALFLKYAARQMVAIYKLKAHVK